MNGAMPRIWLDPDRFAARRLTVQDEDAIRNQNASIPAGRIESSQVEFSVSLKGTLHTPKQFESLIVAYRDGYPVRLEDVARVELGAEDTRKIGRFNGKSSLGISVSRQSKANTLAVARALKEQLPSISAGLPAGMDLTVAWDSSTPIERSLHEVYVALAFVTVSRVGDLCFWAAYARRSCGGNPGIHRRDLHRFGAYRVLAERLDLAWPRACRRLVVDDAVIVLENIHRRIVAGMPPIRAASEGTNEIAFAVIATTISLVTVFIPIAFLTGIVGRLFTELAIAVASAVLLSGFVALTLTPMMCGRLLRQEINQFSRSRFALRFSESVARRYRHVLAWAINARTAVVIMAVGASRKPIHHQPVTIRIAPGRCRVAFRFLTALKAPILRYTDTYAKELESYSRRYLRSPIRIRWWRAETIPDG